MVRRTVHLASSKIFPEVNDFSGLVTSMMAKAVVMSIMTDVGKDNYFVLLTTIPPDIIKRHSNGPPYCAKNK